MSKKFYRKLRRTPFSIRVVGVVYVSKRGTKKAPEIEGAKGVRQVSLDPNRTEHVTYYGSSGAGLWMTDLARLQNLRDQNSEIGGGSEYLS